MRHKYWALSVFLGIVALCLDRATKVFFVQQPLYVASLGGGLLKLQYYLNTAMAFSLPLFPLVYFTLVILVFIMLIRQLMRAMQHQNLAEFTIGVFVVIGAVSNLFDRWRYGGVVDFIHIPLGSIFNLADVYIIVSMLVWIVVLWRKSHATNDSKQTISTSH